MSGPAILIAVESLYGRGHLARAAALARALNAADLPTTLLTGACDPPADLAHIALPPLRAADETISTLLTPAGDRPDSAYWARRRRVALSALEKIRPAVLITESFPFGRPRFTEEMLALLDAAARLGAQAISSVRDILVTKRDPRFYRRAAEIVETRYAKALIHGDADIIHFRETFPHFDRIAGRATHTGYIWSAPAPIAPPPEKEVVVSAGGGRVAAGLLSAAAEARPLSQRFGDAPWRLVAGPDATPAPQPGVIVEPQRDDLPALLQTAAASVSRCGYNTALDVVASGAPAVFAPFGGARQTEQSVRAKRFAALGLATVVETDPPTPAALAAALDRAADERRSPRPIDVGGLARSVAEIAAVAA